MLAGPAQAARSAAREVTPLRRITLANGLAVVLQVDPRLPRIALAMSYLASPADAPLNKRGVARLTERLMFGATGQLASGEHQRRVEAAGGRSWVRQGGEVTSYLDELPREELGLALWLEAQRMSSLRISPQSLAKARQALLQERDGKLWRALRWRAETRLRSLAMLGHSRHGRAPLGDIRTISAGDVRAFHERFYAPERAVLTLVGDFDVDVALSLIEQTLGRVVRPAAPPRILLAPPAQRTRRTSTLRGGGVHRAALAYGWVVPGWQTFERPAVEVVGEVLAGGRSSRLHQELVRGRGDAYSVGYRFEDLRGASVLQLFMTLKRHSRPARAALVVRGEAAKLKKVPLSAFELAAAKNRLVIRRLERLARPAERAQLLGRYELLAGDASQAFRRAEELRKVDAAAVSRVAKRFLVRHRATAVEAFAARILRRKEPGPRAPKSREVGSRRARTKRHVASKKRPTSRSRKIKKRRTRGVKKGSRAPRSKRKPKGRARASKSGAKKR